MRHFRFNFAIGTLFRILRAFVLKLVTVNQTAICDLHKRDTLCFAFRFSD